MHDGLAPRPYLKTRFAKQDRAPCALRARCISAGDHGQQLSPLNAAGARQETDEGRRLHDVGAGVEGTLS